MRHSAIANQESLSALETEMRKLEGIVKEVVGELGYLREREERFQSTNSACRDAAVCVPLTHLLIQYQRMGACKTSRGSRCSRSSAWAYGRYSIYGRSSNESISLIELLTMAVAVE